MKVKRSWFLLVLISMLGSSCDENNDPILNEDDETELVESIDTLTIIGNWGFIESRVELISLQEGVEIDLSAPDVSTLEWRFMDNDSVVVLDQDTTWTSWYDYDTASMKLFFDDGFYDVLLHNQDSLNLRFYADLIVAEYYTFFKLVR